MSIFKYLILFLIFLSNISCEVIKEAKEFEENKITSNFEKFRFKTKDILNLVLIVANENLSEDVNIERKLVKSTNDLIKTIEYNLDSFNYYIDDFYSTKEEMEYFLRFQNYKDGYFIIYNLDKNFPLKQFEKGFSFYKPYVYQNMNFIFISDTLEDDTLLDIYPNKNFNIKKISDNSDEFLPIINGQILLKKGSKYRLEYNYKSSESSSINIVIKKREVIYYKPNEEPSIKIFYSAPIYILFKANDFNIKYNMSYAFLHHDSYLKYAYQIANIESTNIQWDNLEFSKKEDLVAREVFDINFNNYKKDYILIKINITSDYSFYTSYSQPLCKFKIFQEYYQSYDYNHKIKSNEALYIGYNYGYNYPKIAISNITNLRTFNKNESKNFIYKKDASHFNFIILHSEMAYELTVFDISPNNIITKIYTDEFSYHNFYENVYPDYENLIIFDINKATTLSIKTELGNSTIYYIDYISYISFFLFDERNVTYFKRLNSTEDILSFSSPFALYIINDESNYINLIVNHDDNFIINNGIGSKYLIKDKEYKLSLITEILVSINNNFDSNINIYKDGNLISKLNQENPYVKLDSNYGDIIFKSDKNSVINFYYQISYLYPLEEINIIEFPRDKKGEIMLFELITKYYSTFKYIMDYGYDNYITPDIKIKNPLHYLVIDDPYSKLNYDDKNLKFYLILFGDYLKYETKFIKKYEKEKNKFYYRIKPKENYGIFVNPGRRHQIFKCSNEKINIIITSDNMIQTLEQKSSGNINFDPGVLLTFESESEFIFIKSKKYINKEFEIKYFIPKIENNKVSILIYNKFYLNTNFSILLVEDKNHDDNLVNKIDNECDLLSLINNGNINFKNINYELKFAFDENNKILYEEIDYSKFSTKYLLIKIFTCVEEINLCFFSKTQRIYLEKLEQEKNEEEKDNNEITKIKELTEYNITRDEFMFEYDYNSYLSQFDDILIHIFYPARYYISQLNVINPSFQSFSFDFGSDDVIVLKKDEHVNSNGKFYLIFKPDLGVSFYIQNMIKFFPLNIINNYISKIKNNTVSNGGYQIFNFDIKEDKYIYTSIEKGYGPLFLYSLENKITFNLTNGYTKVEKGAYIMLMDYSQPDYERESILIINLNRYKLNLELNKEYKSIGYYSYYDYEYYTNLAVFINKTKYDTDIYLVSNSILEGYFKCLNNFSFSEEEIIENKFTYYDKAYLNTHIYKIGDYPKTCNQPYFGFQILSSVFELLNQTYEIHESQNLTFKENNTIAFSVKGKNNKGNYIYLITSNYKNLKRIDNPETEYVNMIFSTESTQFKLKSNDQNETNLMIKIFENNNKIKIESLINIEISDRMNYNYINEAKYYINLSKNKIFINHFDYDGNIKFYLSKEDINENNLKSIIDNKEINTDLFELMTNEKFDVDINKIIIMEIQNYTYSELLISPEIQSFVIQNTSNSKFIKANKKYLIAYYFKILLEDNSDANIIVTDINNNYIFTINKDNPIFENEKFNNNSLFLTSDKNTLIYIYHQFGNNSKNFIIPKNKEGQLILFGYDCEKNESKYSLDSGFENYIPLHLRLKYIEDPYLIINTSFEHNKIQNGVDYFAYIECYYKLINNFSGFYENSNLSEGYHFIEKNKPINVNIKLDNLKNKIFYQFFECNSGINNKLHVSIDQKDIEIIERNKLFMKANNEISLYLQGEESFFNYYKTSSTLDDYERLNKNINPFYNITSISENKIEFDLLPKYKNIDFEFYLIIYIDKEKVSTTNPLRNKCYLKKLIDSDNKLKNYINEDKNIIIKKINFKNGNLDEKVLDIPNISNNTVIYSNVFGYGQIFEDVEEYIFYNEQNYNYIIPKKQDDKDDDKNKVEDTSLSVGAIIGIAFGVLAFILIVIFIFLRFKKKNSMKLEEIKDPLNIESKIE